MSVVKINALDVPPEAGDEITKRFAARMNSLSEVPGFEGFELLRPTGEAEQRWFVYTRWADQESYEGWRDGAGARAAHQSGESTGGEPAARPPVSMGATLLEFTVEVQAQGSGV